MTFGYGGPSIAATFVAGALNEAAAYAKLKSNSANAAFAEAKSELNNIQKNPSDAALRHSAHKSDDPVTSDRQTAIVAERGAREAALVSGRDSAGVNMTLKVRDALVSDMTTYFATYFPSANGLRDAAIERAQQQLDEGGLTIRLPLEDARFQRFRDESMRGTEVAAQTLMARYAAMPFNAPPGALLGQLDMLREDAQRKVATFSNAMAVEYLTSELAATRASVDRALKARDEAFDVFSDFIVRWSQLRYDQATMEASERDRYVEQLRTAYFTWRDAEVAADMWVQNTSDKLYETLRADAKAHEEYTVKRIETLAEGAMENAQRLGNVAAAAFNSMHGGSSIGLNESL